MPGRSMALIGRNRGSSRDRAVTRGEILFFRKGRSGDDAEPNSKETRQSVPVLRCESIPSGAGDRYANVKVSQERRGVALDENDLWIAATWCSLQASAIERA